MKKKITPFSIFSITSLGILTVIFVFPFYWIMTGAYYGYGTSKAGYYCSSCADD